MGFFSDWFKKGEDPEPSCGVEGLGSVVWSEEDEAWFGRHNDFRFSLAYHRTRTPGDDLVEYAREVLNDPDWLMSTLRVAKEEAKRSFYGKHLGEAEIDGLTLGAIHFHSYKGQRRILAHLDGGGRDRLWRIEYADRVCEGIGFDS